MVGFVIPKSAASASLAGATIDEETGEMKVKAETIAVAAHFCLNVQLMEAKSM